MLRPLTRLRRRLYLSRGICLIGDIRYQSSSEGTTVCSCTKFISIPATDKHSTRTKHTFHPKRAFVILFLDRNTPPSRVRKAYLSSRLLGHRYTHVGIQSSRERCRSVDERQCSTTHTLKRRERSRILLGMVEGTVADELGVETSINGPVDVWVVLARFTRDPGGFTSPQT